MRVGRLMGPGNHRLVPVWPVLCLALWGLPPAPGACAADAGRNWPVPNEGMVVYRFGTTNAWETLASNTTSADCSTADCTVTGTPAGTANESFEAEGSSSWASFRLWQSKSTASETLETDRFTATTPSARRIILIQ